MYISYTEKNVKGKCPAGFFLGDKTLGKTTPLPQNV